MWGGLRHWAFYPGQALAAPPSPQGITRGLQSEESKTILQSNDLVHIVDHYSSLKKELCGVLANCSMDFLEKHKAEAESPVNELKIIAWYIMTVHLMASEDMMIRAMETALDRVSGATGDELEKQFMASVGNKTCPHF